MGLLRLPLHHRGVEIYVDAKKKTEYFSFSQLSECVSPVQRCPVFTEYAALAPLPVCHHFWWLSRRLHGGHQPAEGARRREEKRGEAHLCDG